MTYARMKQNAILNLEDVTVKIAVLKILSILEGVGMDADEAVQYIQCCLTEGVD